MELLNPNFDFFTSISKLALFCDVFPIFFGHKPSSMFLSLLFVFEIRGIRRDDISIKLFHDVLVVVNRTRNIFLTIPQQSVRLPCSQLLLIALETP